VLLFAEYFLALGKDVFADEIAAECPLPSATLGKIFAECNRGFAECLGSDCLNREDGFQVWSTTPK
jgi:hypothetical protein